MYIVTTKTYAYRLIGRSGSSYAFADLTALARALIEAGYYSQGGVYGLSGAIVERFTTWYDPATGQAHSDGIYRVQDADGEPVSRECIADACCALRVARRRRSHGRGWYHRPRRSKIFTGYDRRHSEAARHDLAEIDPRLARIVEPRCRIDDPYEPAPRRTPQRSWKSHRDHQYR